MIYISQLSASLIFLQIFNSNSKKSDVRVDKTLKWNLILMFFDSTYPTRPSGIVTKYAI